MIHIEEHHIDNIPYLQVVQQQKENEPLPLIFFIHGFTSGKEQNLNYAYLLAEKGYRVILPDCLYHGSRQESFAGNHELTLNFWKIIIHTINDMGILKDHFESKQLILDGRIGLAGTSMGGIITLGALTQYNWIKAAVSLMGSPSYVDFARYQIDSLKKKEYSIELSTVEIEEQLEILRQYDLSITPETLENRPVLFWHGKKDPIVPYTFARQFYDEIKTANNNEGIMFITDNNAGHKVSRDGVLKTVEWFTQYL